MHARVYVCVWFCSPNASSSNSPFPFPRSQDGKHGKANGALVWKGVESRRTRVRSLHKPDWRLISPAAAAAGAGTPALDILKAAEAAKPAEAAETAETAEAKQ